MSAIGSLSSPLPAISGRLAQHTRDQSWGYGLLILTTMALFLRPSEMLPGFENSRIYLVLIVACLAFSLPLVASQLSLRSLREQPTSACVIGLLGAVVMSHLSHGFFWGARTCGVEFSKQVVYYLLLLGLLNTQQRLLRFIGWLWICIVASCGLALLHDFGLINIPGLEALEVSELDPDTGELITMKRLRSTGIFNDPNDFALVLVVGLMLTLYFVCDAQRGLKRLIGLLPLGVLGYALAMTQSRGGFLSLITAVNVLVLAKLGWKKGLLVTPVALVLMAAILGSRMTDYSSLVEGTGQTRIQLWSESMSFFEQFPLFGMGQDMLHEELGLVTHNSFLQCYVELGFVGGSLFLGAFVFTAVLLYRVNRDPLQGQPFAGLVPFLLAALAGYSAGLLSLSREYVAPTYLILGLSGAAIAVAHRSPHVRPLRVDVALMQRLVLLSAAFIAFTYIFIRLFVRWS